MSDIDFSKLDLNIESDSELGSVIASMAALYHNQTGDTFDPAKMVTIFQKYQTAILSDEKLQRVLLSDQFFRKHGQALHTILKMVAGIDQNYTVPLDKIIAAMEQIDGVVRKIE